MYLKQIEAMYEVNRKGGFGKLGVNDGTVTTKDTMKEAPRKQMGIAMHAWRFNNESQLRGSAQASFAFFFRCCA